MPHCPAHCPPRSRWLVDLLLMLALLAGLYWGVGKVAPVVDLAARTALGWAGWALAVGAAAVAVKVAVGAVLNRRALAEYRRIEREAWSAPGPGETPVLTPAARALEASPSVYAQAWVVRDIELDAERDVA